MNEHSIKPQLMDIIPQETSRICSDPNLKDITQDSPSLDLIIQAYERIRSLSEENEELQQEIRTMQEKGIQSEILRCEIQKLKQVIKDKDLRIQNLQKISEKAIMDYVKIERQLQLVRLQSGKIKRNLRLSSEVNSPLHPVIVNNQPENYLNETPQSLSPYNKLKFQQKTQFKKEPFRFRRNEHNQNVNLEFTFDTRPRNTHSPNSNKVLKNCFSTIEMTKLVNKVHHRHESILKNQQSQITNYHNYCSSIQKKYSPGLSVKNQHRQPVFYQNAKNSCSGSPKGIQLKMATFGQKNWDLTNTASSYTAASFGKSRDNRPIKLFP